MSIPTTLRAGAVALTAAVALIPAAAQAKPAHHGLSCGKGHARHSRALGHKCARHHGRTNHAQSRAATTQQTTTSDQTTTQQQGGQQQNPARECRSERQSDSQAFSQQYGSGSNAFGKCVSQHARAQRDDQQGDDNDQGDSDQQDQQGDDDAPSGTTTTTTSSSQS